VADQVEWHVMDAGVLTPATLSAEEWKDIFTAALNREKIVPGISGGFVVIGRRTSNMTVKEMCELQDLIEAFAAERGVTLPWEMWQD
jgi:porphobilinogen deaminase